MDSDFRSRLSFSAASSSTYERENWKEALLLLPNPVVLNPPPSLVAQIPSFLDESPQGNQLQWIITENSHATRVTLIPFFNNGLTTYAIPSFSHLFTLDSLNGFDKDLVHFLGDYLCHDEAHVVLEVAELIHLVLWTLVCAKRLKLSPAVAALEIAEPLQLKARLRYDDTQSFWILEPQLLTSQGTNLSPEEVDFITESGLVACQGRLHLLPQGAAWVVQHITNSAWFIAKEALGEALYRLSLKIQSGDFLKDLTQIECKHTTPAPIIYLRSKSFEQQAHISLYLAFRYGISEVFSLWHQEIHGASLPLGFESVEEEHILYFRDSSTERQFESLITHSEGLSFIASKRVWHANVASLWVLIHNWLQNGWEVWAEKNKIESLSDFGVTLESGIGWFELQPQDTLTKQRIDPLQLIKYLKRKALFIQLGHGKMAVLPEQWINHLTHFLDIGSLQDEKKWCFASLFAQEVAEILGNEETFQADTNFYETLARMRGFNGIKTLEQPAGFRALLRPYQLEGLTWLNLLCDLHLGGILADDMGLGKTIQILALLHHRLVNQVQETPQTVLIVCPKSVQNHWFTQISNLTPKLPTRIISSKDLRVGLKATGQHEVWLASYGLIRHHIQTLSEHLFDLLILDEAQIIKNSMSLTTQAIKQLNARQRFALTATPIENKFEELVSIFSFLNPHAQLSLNSTTATPESVRHLLEKILHPFVLRRLKKDVLPDLPPKTIEEISLAMLPTQGRLYKELQEIYRHEITKHKTDHALPTESDAAFFLEGLMRLRQVATHPQQLLSTAFQDCASNKMLYLCEQLPILIAKGHRVVVFSQFLGFLRDLSDALKDINIYHSYVDGSTTNREQTIASFQSYANTKILLISLKVGGVGIDLTGADVCILADPWWNEAVEMQAIDRLHRFGQKKEVKVLRLISQNSIEEQMELLKKNKSALADAIGKTRVNFLQHINWDDFTIFFRE